MKQEQLLNKRRSKIGRNLKAQGGKTLALATAVLVAFGVGMPSAAIAAPGDLAHGVIHVDSNNNGAVNTSQPTGENDTPLAGVKVTLIGADPTQKAETTTDADGNWSFKTADVSGIAGPYTVMINADGLGGDNYLTPTAKTAGVNDFERVVDNSDANATQKSIATIPADANDVELNALVYPTWSTDVIAMNDPDGFGGYTIYTGTAPFDADDSEPGQDAGDGNNRVRTSDVINHSWSITASAEQDLGSSFDAWFEQELVLEPGAVATFGQMPNSCGTGSEILALPSGDVLQPRQDPPSGTTSVVLKCNLGATSVDKANHQLDTQVFVSGSSENGATFTTNVRTYGADENGVTTARPDGPHEFGPFEITAAPRYDIEKQRPWVWQLGTKTVDVNGTPTEMRGYEVSYSINITTDRTVGNEAFEQPVTFEDALWANTADGSNTLKTPFKWYMMHCGPDGLNAQNTSVGPGGSTVYGKVGTPIFGGGVTTAENSVVDSGTCSYERVGDADTGNYKFTLDGIDTSGSSYPTKSQNGTALAADKFYVAAYTVRVFIPFDEVDAMNDVMGDYTGKVNIWNRVGDFDPKGKSGASNYGSADEPGYCEAGPSDDRSSNCDTMPDGTSRSNNVSGPANIEISPGNGGKTLVDQRMSWNMREANMPESAGQAGAGQVQPGQAFTSKVQALFNFDTPDVEMIDVWDNSMMKLAPFNADKPNDPNDTSGPVIPDDLYSVGTNTVNGDNRNVALAYQDNFTFKYAHVNLTDDVARDTANNGNFDSDQARYEGDWTNQATAASGTNSITEDASITWYDNPNDVPGGIDEVNAVWMKTKDGYKAPAGYRLQMLTVLEQRNTYYGGPNDGEEIPAGTIAANFGNIKSPTYGAGDWVVKNHPYVPGSGTTNDGTYGSDVKHAFGDRWTLTRATMAITKYTIEGTVNGEDATGASDIGVTGSAKAGTPVIWQIDPSLSAVSDDPAPVNNVTVTDTLPKGVEYDAAGTEELGTTMPSSVTVNANGTTTLVWQLGTLTPNEPIGSFKVATHVDPFQANNSSLVNKVNIKADGIIAVQQSHNDDHTVTVTQPGGLQLKKTVDAPLDLQDKDQVYTLQVKNFAEALRYAAPTVIDVLPYNGDKVNSANVNRNPASDYEGTSKLDAAPTADVDGTFYYTTIDPANVPQNLNDDIDPSIWSTTFTADATAFKFVAANRLGNVNEGTSSGLKITFKTNQADNAAGDLYANRFTAFSETASKDGVFQLLTSNQVLVRVVGFSLGDLIWLDTDDDGKYTAGTDTVAPEGVKVNVYNEAGDKVGETTTNADGRWVINDLPEGKYYAEIPASEFAAGDETTPAGPLAGYIAQDKGYEADPNNDANEGTDHNGAQQSDGSVKTGLITLSATVNGSTITGDEPTDDNTGGMTVTPGTTDDFTNFTLDMALKTKPVPGYEFTKTSDPESGTAVNPGDTITYTLTGTNSGETTLSPVVITDDLSNVLNNATYNGDAVAQIDGVDAASQPSVNGTTLTWLSLLQSLQPGQSVRVTYSVTLNDDAAGVLVNNHAESTATPPGEPPITPPPGETEHPTPGYEFDKTSDPVSGSTVVAGDDITYTITGENTGKTDLEVEITDDLTKVLEFSTIKSEPVAVIEGADNVPAAERDGNALSWNGTLKPGETVTVTYTVTVGEGHEGKILNNHAESEATPPGLPPITPPPVETEHPIPGYEFAKSSDPASVTAVAPGSTVTYTLTGENTGATALDPVLITDDLSNVLNNAELTIDPVATIDGEDSVPAPVVDGTALTWTGSLEVGQSVTITYTVTLNDDANGVLINNHAESEATPPGKPPITPPPGETEHPTPDYEFTKSSDPESGTTVVPGETITYTLTGSNTGKTVLDPVMITDDLSKVLNHANITIDPVATIEGEDSVPQPSVDGTDLKWTGSLKEGQSVKITYTVTLNDDAVGVIVNNHAESEATPPGLPPITPPEVETWHPTPGYTFMKTADPVSGTAVQAGDEITYTLTGTNSGETVLDPVNITDDLSQVLEFAELTGQPTATIDGTETSAPSIDGTTLAWSGKLEKGEQVQVVYTVKVKAGFEGKTLNNHAESDATPPGKPPITPPPVETEHPIPGFTIDKTSDPASGSKVKPGSVVTYTVTGTNTGATKLDPVNITDDLSKVLNHSALSGTPSATIIAADGTETSATAPVLVGTTLKWSGTLEIGERVELNYSVKVNENAKDVKLYNLVVGNATPPGLPPITPPPAETEHEVPPSLPVTGGTLAGGAIALALILGLGGGALLLSRRRNRVVAGTEGGNA
ncbi:DUF11 domain-containing protein [Leucobacter sp. cx-328]|nr:DUF11 domain-containing protein [Leucobacter sp. cx-328]